LKLQYDELLLNFAYNLSLRLYTWVMLRARLMEVTKLCTALEPLKAAGTAAMHVSTVLGWLSAGGPLDAAAAAAAG